MYMEQVELFKLHHIHEFAGKRCVVGRIFKQRIFLRRDLVKIDIFVKSAQTSRSPVRDEVYLMPALRQAQTQLGRQYATTAVGRITNDAYFHGVFLKLERSICIE